MTRISNPHTFYHLPPQAPAPTLTFRELLILAIAGGVTANCLDTDVATTADQIVDLADCILISMED